MATLTSLLVTTLALIPCVTAHMEMVWPIPFNSKYDSSYYRNVDYSNTSPLLASGANYPCKGYQTEGQDKVQAVYDPGQQYNMTLAGSATHGGGSCQLSLSYDNGVTFHVIKSMIGGCPLKDTWNFAIPANAPAANNALFAWTWFNLEGNREMYMNCARVQITGNTAQKRKRSAKERRAAVALTSLPDNFACNIGDGCTTIEGESVVFPNPGVVVEIDPAVNLNLAGYTLSGPTPTGNAYLSGTLTATSIASLSISSTYTPLASSVVTGTATILSTPATTAGTSAATNSAISTASTAPASGLTITNTLTSGVTTVTLTNASFPTETQVPGVSGSATVVGPQSSSSAPRVTSSPSSGNPTPSNTAGPISVSSGGIFVSQSPVSSSLSSSAAAVSATGPAITGSITLSPFPPLPTSFSTVTLNSTSLWNGTTNSACFTNTTATPVPLLNITTMSFTTTAFINSTSTMTRTVTISAPTPSSSWTGNLTITPGGSCSIAGTLTCDGASRFYLCLPGGAVVGGPVAAGTICQNGQIVNATWAN